MKACFFAKVESPEVFERVKFYADDIRILKELGFEVKLATRYSEIPWGCDLYFIWWWTWAFQPLLKAKISNRPSLITGVFDYATPPKGLRLAYTDRPFWQQALMRWALRTARANVFVSKYERDQVGRHFPWAKADFVPCAVDLERYVPSEEPSGDHLLCVAWSGRVNALRKCLPQVIEAFPLILQQNPGVRLLMAGRQGEYHPELVRRAHELGVADKVEFLGVISEEEKIRLMQTCRLYLQPTMFEGFGLAIAEAMACGAPVVSSPEGAVPEVVGEAGVLVPHHDPVQIAAAANRVLGDPVLRHRLKREARAQVERFSYRRRRDELAVIIGRITGRRVGLL